MARTRTQVIRTGSVYEKNKQNLRKKFSKKFADVLWDAVRKNKVENLQVCLSQHTAKEITSDWLPKVKKLISKKVYGNYIELHPLDVLKRLEEKGVKVSGKK